MVVSQAGAKKLVNEDPDVFPCLRRPVDAVKLCQSLNGGNGGLSSSS